MDKGYGFIKTPINEGDEIDLEIISIGSEGDGVGKIDKFVVIVPKTKEGNTYRVKITKVLRNVSFGEVIEQDVETNEDNTEETTEHEQVSEVQE